MQGKKSAYLKSAIINHILGIDTYVKPTNVYLALYTSDPTENDTGDEVAGGSYARQQISSWEAEVEGLRQAANDMSFPDMPACTVTHWGLHDASSGGNLLYFGAFDISIPYNTGEDANFAAENIYFAED